MAKTKIGKVKILLKGEYNADTQYIKLDSILYNKSLCVLQIKIIRVINIST